MLTRNRIWGNIVGAGDRSGYKEMARGLQGKTKKSYYEFESLKLQYPFIAQWEKQNKQKEKYQDRKLRIFMRGMKVGQQKGKGASMQAMSVFEMAGKKAESG